MIMLPDNPISIFLLKRKDKRCFDEYQGFVVAAIDMVQARHVAALHDKAYANVWLDSRLSKCSEIGIVTTKQFSKPGIILQDYTAG